VAVVGVCDWNGGLLRSGVVKVLVTEAEVVGLVVEGGEGGRCGEGRGRERRGTKRGGGGA
jgi:hypothetical protein